MDTDRRIGGFTLVEVLVTCFVFAILVLGVGHAVVSAVQTAGGLKENHAVYAQAQTILDTVTSIRFGRPEESAPGSPDLVELLDGNTFRGPVSVCQLRLASPIDFTLDGFPHPGGWSLRVHNDLNGDGDTLDFFETGDDILRVDVFHDGTLVASTLRAAPTPLEEAGESNVLFGAAAPGDTTPPLEDLARGVGVTVVHLGYRNLGTGPWVGAEGPASPGEPRAVP